MLIHTQKHPYSLSWPCSCMDEFDFDFVWRGDYFQPACRACEQCMPNGTNKYAWCQLSGVAWQWEATGFCLFCGCKRCDKRGLTGGGGRGMEVLAHEGMDDKFFEWWETREKHDASWEGMFFIFTFLIPVMAWERNACERNGAWMEVKKEG